MDYERYGELKLEMEQCRQALDKARDAFERDDPATRQIWRLERAQKKFNWANDRFIEAGAILSQQIMAKWLAAISQAAQAFEARWTMLALRRVDADLATRLHEQRNLFVEAYVTGEIADVDVHGAAMCRGYVVAIAAMESVGVPDDAYQLGQCPKTGTLVAIGDQKAAVNRVREVYGDGVIFISPDEVASLFASVEALKSVGVVKQRFPGAEIVERGLLMEGGK